MTHRPSAKFAVRFAVLCSLTWGIGGTSVLREASAAEPLQHPLSDAEREQLRADQQAILDETTAVLKANPQQVDLYSSRGDARFFLADFPGAVADYEKMVELKPDLDAGHWRRGIAYFYAGQFKEAAGQFERYHSFDDVDRENGIWRYFSQYKADGPAKAKAGLLKYKKDDREPFPAVYKLFSGDLQAPIILDQINSAKLTDKEREPRLFYAELYIGLNADLEPGHAEEAAEHLRASVANGWPRTAGYGPRYMWHVGRLHFERLQKQLEKKQP